MVNLLDKKPAVVELSVDPPVEVLLEEVELEQVAVLM